MLPQESRIRTREIARLLKRTDTQKIIAYPFVYFLRPLWRRKKLHNLTTGKTVLHSPATPSDA